MRFLWEMVVLGTPISAQARRRDLRDAWEGRVKRSAEFYWNKQNAPIDREISVNIIYFFLHDVRLDVDNIVKLILDGIVGVAILDDYLVSQILARKTPMRPHFVLENATPAIARGLESRSDFIYLTVTDPPKHEKLP